VNDVNGHSQILDKEDSPAEMDTIRAATDPRLLKKKLKTYYVNPRFN